MQVPVTAPRPVEKNNIHRTSCKPCKSSAIWLNKHYTPNKLQAPCKAPRSVEKNALHQQPASPAKAPLLVCKRKNTPSGDMNDMIWRDRRAREQRSRVCWLKIKVLEAVERLCSTAFNAWILVNERNRTTPPFRLTPPSRSRSAPCGALCAPPCACRAFTYARRACTPLIQIQPPPGAWGGSWESIVLPLPTSLQLQIEPFLLFVTVECAFNFVTKIINYHIFVTKLRYNFVTKWTSLQNTARLYMKWSLQRKEV